MADLRSRFRILPINLGKKALAVEESGGDELNVGEYESIRLNYQEQKQTEWCWATCAAMIGEYCKGQDFEQCKFASQLYQLGCCGDVLTSGCNQPCLVSDVNQVYESISVVSVFVDRALTFAEIESEIAMRRAVEVGIAWTAGSGHVLLLTNVERLGDKEYVEIMDPWPSSKGGRTGVVLYSELLVGFGRGKWRWAWVGIQ